MHYFERYFVNRSKPVSLNYSEPSFFSDLSDNCYDSCKGVNLLYVNYGTEDKPCHRLVSDVELAFSSDPVITSIVPPAVQSNLRLGIQSQPRNGNSVSDDIPVNLNLEMDEVARLGSQMLDKHNQQCIDDYNLIVDKKLSSTSPSDSSTSQS